MDFSVLYYPKFEPPQKWLRSVLLFVDQVQRIIPSDAQHLDSEPMRRLIDAIPAAFQSVSPTKDDTFFEDLNLARLEKAFALIRDECGGQPLKSFTFNVGTGGGIKMKGNVWLSNSKLEERVRKLLLKYDLATDAYNPYTGSRPFGDTLPANEGASDLIVSYIADKIAKRTGLNTITDVEIPYAVQSLDALQASSASLSREGDGMLAAAIANLVIPDGIEHLTVLEYQELRQSFVEIRAPFHELVRTLAIFSCIDRQQSASALESRLEHAIREYQRRMAKYQSSVSARRIDKWVPMFLQGILGVLLEISPPLMSFLMATGIVSIDVMKAVIASGEREITQKATFRMLCELQKGVGRRVGKLI